MTRFMTRFLCVLTGPVAPTKIKPYLVPAGGGLDRRREMGPPYFFVIEAAGNPDIGALLYRLDSNGDSVGDTWHRNVEEAKGQAACEYEGFVQEWHEIPPGIDVNLLPLSIN
jgi:hypothetical protein